MKRSVDRILTTHGGAMRRPDDLAALISARDASDPRDEARLWARVETATQEIVRQQAEAGVDIINDGEFPKLSWSEYYASRLTGIDKVQVSMRKRAGWFLGRDSEQFQGWYALAARGGGPLFSSMLRIDNPMPAPGGYFESTACTGPITYVGQAEVKTHIDNLKAAAKGVEASDLFISAIGPAIMEMAQANVFYKTSEEYVFAIAEAMREEYKAITDAGIVLQIDEPAITGNWSKFSDMTLEEYRRWAAVRVEAVNHALKGVNPQMVRIHFCWGSWHAPHAGDIPLRDILDLLVKINAGAISIEASNPRHAHEWEVWKDIKLPEGKILIPGVVGHFSDYIEHPELVAQRLTQYAGVVGRENVIAGTDCGLGSRVGHPEICWAKLRAMRDGAALASKQLW